MSKQTSALAFAMHLPRGRIVVLLALAALSAGTGCEDKQIGRPCQLSKDLQAEQGAYTIEASDCPSRICVKPNVQPGVSTGLDTVAYCTDQCTSDNDCNGQTREPDNSNDRRCRKGFTCAPIFGEGPLCCKKLCLCRDFYVSSVGPAIPEPCKPGSDKTCS